MTTEAKIIDIVVSVTNPSYAPAKRLADLLTTSKRFQVKQLDLDRYDVNSSDVALMFVTLSDLSEVVQLTRYFLNNTHDVGVKYLAWVAPACPQNSNLGAKLAEAEVLVRSSHPDALILRHAPLISDLFQQNKEIKFRRTLSLPLGDNVLPWLAPEDIAQGLYRWLSGEIRVQPPEVLTGLSQLTGKDLARAISQALERNLDSRRYARRWFQEIDTDRSGKIDAEELYSYLYRLGYDRTEAQGMLETADTNKDGLIDFEEFLAGLSEHLDRILADVPSQVQYIDVTRATALHDLVAGGMTQKTALASLELLDALQESGLPTNDSARHWLGRPSMSLKNWLERYVLDFINVYILPARGILTIDEGVFEGSLAINTRILQSDDRLLIGMHTLDGKAMDWQLADRDISDAQVVSYQPETGGERILKLKDDKLVGISVRGTWLERRLATELFFKNTSIPTWQINLFRELGELQIEATSTLMSSQDMICNCTQTTYGKLQQLIESGLDTLEELANATQITMICGSCKPLVEEVLGSASLAIAELLSKRHLGRGIFHFVLRPVKEAVVVCKPGQHILIQGRVDGIWVTRAYTLSSPANQTQAYEITVKREEMGLFSRWLCDRADSDALFRISQPRGKYYLTDEPQVYFFAAGIGVTPAIAMMRTLVAKQDKRQFHLDWSASHPEDFVFKNELKQLTQAHPNFSVTLHSTRTEGRLSLETVQRQYPPLEEAVAFLCGPQAYMDAVREHLQAAGWSDSAIKQELFSSNLDEEGKAQKPIPQRPIVQLAGAITPVESHSFDIQPVNSVAQEAEVFLKQCYLERGLPEVFLPRWQEVNELIKKTGTYEHTLDELTYGGRLAWRNSSRCVGRYFWQSLHVRDMRHLETEAEMFDAIVEHIKLATNNGDIRAMMTVFKPDGRRLWNSQLLRYAGYCQPNGTILGDPANVELTEQALKLGWSKDNRTAFDYLPIIIQLPGKEPHLWEIPPEIILDVPLSHPSYQWFEELGLKWYALPAVSNMALDLGGIQYTCMPFNGFYMGTEIGARNFSDSYRYDMLPTIANLMELDCSSNNTLWKDEALIALNRAVLHSFEKHGVRLLDHHTMTDYFMQFMEEEHKCQRPVHADWGWIVPPISGSATPVYPVEMNNRILKPNYFYQSEPWKTDASNNSNDTSCPFKIH